MQNHLTKRHVAMAGLSLALLAVLCLSPSLFGDRVSSAIDGLGAADPGLLWAAGNKDGALKLEHFWDRIQAEEKFPLLCAYARTQIKDDLESDLRTICAAHTRVVPGYV
jgi:hypothetical protein